MTMRRPLMTIGERRERLFHMPRDLPTAAWDDPAPPVAAERASARGLLGRILRWLLG